MKGTAFIEARKTGEERNLKLGGRGIQNVIFLFVIIVCFTSSSR